MLSVFNLQQYKKQNKTKKVKIEKTTYATTVFNTANTNPKKN